MHQALAALVVALGAMGAQELGGPLARRGHLARAVLVLRDRKERLDPLVLQVRKTARQESATRKKWFVAAVVPPRNAPLTRCLFAGLPVEAKPHL